MRCGPALSEAERAEYFLCTAAADPNSGCLLWLGSRNRGGYGIASVKTDGRWKTVILHRWLYQQKFGPVTNDLDMDHLCRVRNCINPAHLEVVTRRENTMRGMLPFITALRHARVTHCPHGHPYEGANLYVARSGGRQCKICRRRRHNEAREQRRIHSSSSDSIVDRVKSQVGIRITPIGDEAA